MKTLIAVVAMVLALTGCVIVPANTAGKVCYLLNAAAMEAEMSPGWHDSAGDVLVECGIRDAKVQVEIRACEAQRRAGYDC